MENSFIKDLVQFDKEHDLLDAQNECQEQLKEVKRINSLKKKEDDSIDLWLNNYGIHDAHKSLVYSW